MVDNPGGNMDTYARDVVAPDLDLAGVQPGTDLDAEGVERVSERSGAPDRPAWPVERRQDAVPRQLHQPPTAPLDDRPAHRVMGIEKGTPATIAEQRRVLGRADDVSEQDGRQSAVSLGDGCATRQEALNRTNGTRIVGKTARMSMRLICFR